MMMHTPRISLLVRAVLIGAVGALTACGLSHQPQLGGGGLAVRAPHTRGVDPNDFTFQRHGVPWDRTDRYIHEMMGSVKKPAFTDSFPNANIDIVRICEDCRLMEVAFFPERRSHGLFGSDFGDSMRVIGQVVLLHFLPPTGNDHPETDFATRLLGLSAELDSSYLVTLSSNRAAFMYRSGDTIAFTPQWTFVDSGDGITLPKSQARWRHVTHPTTHLVRVDSPRPHIVEPWVACADGCCTATAVSAVNLRTGASHRREPGRISDPPNSIARATAATERPERRVR
jgi:hypothetical protein